ncbi:alpha/beta hydrolase-fold protein [Streptomyces sp. NPDC006356]
MSDPSVEKLSTGEWSPERFGRHLQETGTPLVERVSADEVEVTFVDEPGDDTTVALSVVIGPRIGFNPIDTEFAPVAGPTGEGEQVPDPFNPPPRFSECSVERFSGASVAVLPDAAPSPWLDQAEARPDPTTDSAVLASESLGNERRIWVSMPPGEFLDESALPFAINLDGTPEHSAPSVRDALVRAGLIRPCVVVLVEQSALRRTGWTALHHPKTFGNAILQSPSCGYHPDLTWGTGAAELLHRTPVPTLIADFLAEETAPVRIFHDVGELESSLAHSRWLDHVLTGKGYDTLYREFAGGQDYAWWRGLFADALLWCFPLRSRDGSHA